MKYLKYIIPFTFFISSFITCHNYSKYINEESNRLVKVLYKEGIYANADIPFGNIIVKLIGDENKELTTQILPSIYMKIEEGDLIVIPIIRDKLIDHDLRDTIIRLIPIILFLLGIYLGFKLNNNKKENESKRIIW